jgi:hypothetical protein
LDPGRKERLGQMVCAIEALGGGDAFDDACRGGPIDELTIISKGAIHLAATNLEWHEARRRFEIIEAQIDVVCPDDEMNEDAAWILEANINNLRGKPDKTEIDQVLLMFLLQFNNELEQPVEFHQYKSTGANPWETDRGGRVKAGGMPADAIEHLDYTKAGKKARTKAQATVRQLDPTATPVAVPKDRRGEVLGVGWNRLDDSDRLVPLDTEGLERRRKTEARRTSEFAKQARTERRLGIKKSIKEN